MHTYFMIGKYDSDATALFIQIGAGRAKVRPLEEGALKLYRVAAVGLPP